MVLKKEGIIYCDQCGNELGHKIVCSSCGVMYPDYYLVQGSKPLRRQVEKPKLNLNLSFSLKPASMPSYTYTYTSYKDESKTSALSINARFFGAGVAALVALLVVGLGVFFYHKIQLEQEYTKYFMRALFTIKTGTDLSLNTCAKISTEWKTKQDMSYYTPHISGDDETRLNKVKDAADRYLQKLNKPPKKFINTEEKLNNLYGVYTKAYSLAVSPSGSLSDFTQSTGKVENDFNIAIKDLKANLPEELSTELQKAKAKFKNLQEI